MDFAAGNGLQRHGSGVWDFGHNVWAGGGNTSGMIVKWDGAVWTEQTAPALTVLYGVWGTDANNVWAVRLQA